ncbi:MAG: MBOAT family protein [Alphaproteobacteria bacterium]|nr:MBOAT family protein [Alphaproteobacteria bacterium]
MLFNSLSFLFVFLPIALVGCRLLERAKRSSWIALWLGIISLAFYGWDDPLRLLPLILASICFNFLVGTGLAQRPSRSLLALGIIGNLALLGYFKYAGFLLDSLGLMGVAGLPEIQVALPIGISFYTFTQIAFLVDAYSGKAREYRFGHYLLFVTFFPHLVAGPILHHKDMMPQFERRQRNLGNLNDLTLGLSIFLLGLFKKVVLADGVAVYVAPAFDAAAQGASLGPTDAWMGALAFTLQLYFDFSGYSDMAVGLARMFGIDFPINFNSPYKAASLIDFWRRWHMTLSRFLRDYLYIPLGGNRQGPTRRLINLMLTMLIGGLWHGAAWTFVLWGGLHGLGLVVNHLWRLGPGKFLALPRWLSWGITFIFVVLAWVPFRAENFDAAIALWRGMFLGAGENLPQFDGLEPLQGWAWIVGLLSLAVLAPNSQEIMLEGANKPLAWKPARAWGILLGGMGGMALAMIVMQAQSEFLYFRF